MSKPRDPEGCLTDDAKNRAVDGLLTSFHQQKEYRDSEEFFNLGLSRAPNPHGMWISPRATRICTLHGIMEVNTGRGFSHLPEFGKRSERSAEVYHKSNECGIAGQNSELWDGRK
jgi:hypothetical protein